MFSIRGDKNEFDPTYKVQDMRNGAFQNAPFGYTPFPNGI